MLMLSVAPTLNSTAVKDLLMNLQRVVGRHSNTSELEIKTTNNTRLNHLSPQIHTGDIECQGPSGGNENNVGQMY